MEGWAAGRQQLDQLKLHKIRALGLLSASFLCSNWGRAGGRSCPGRAGGSVPGLELHLDSGYCRLFSCPVFLGSWQAQLESEKSLGHVSSKTLAPVPVAVPLLVLAHACVIAWGTKWGWRGWKMAWEGLIWFTWLCRVILQPDEFPGCRSISRSSAAAGCRIAAEML